MISQPSWSQAEEPIALLRSAVAEARDDWGLAVLAALTAAISLLLLTSWLQKELLHWLQDARATHQIMAPRVLWAALSGCLGLALETFAEIGPHRPTPWQAMAMGFWSAALLLAALIDLRCRLLPDRMTLTIAILGLGLAGWGQFVRLDQALLGGLLGYAIPWMTNRWATRSGRMKAAATAAIGRGDMALLGGVGLWLGASGVIGVLLASSLLLLLTAGVQGLMNIRRRLSPPGSLPMGPAIAACAWLGPANLVQWPGHMGWLSIVADFSA